MQIKTKGVNKMKKTSVIILTAVLVFVMAACSKSASAPVKKDEPKESATQVTAQLEEEKTTETTQLTEAQKEQEKKTEKTTEAKTEKSGEKTTEEAETTEEVDFTSIRPQDDFYGYINGEDLSNVDVLYYNGDAGAFGSVNANLQEVLKSAIEEIVTSNEEYEYGSKEQRIRDYYNQYVEYYTNEALRNSSKEEIRAAYEKYYANEQFIRHPSTGTIIPGFKIPFWNECKAMVEEVSRLVSDVYLIGWDVAVTPEGPTLVELNTHPGLTAIQSPNGHGLKAEFEKIKD